MNQHPRPPRWLSAIIVIAKLLFVLAITALILFLAFFNQINGQSHSKVRTKAMMKDLQVSIGHYRTEYNRFPVPGSFDAFSKSDLPPLTTDSSSPLISILMALPLPDKATLNPRDIKFIDLQDARNGANGIIRPAADGAPAFARLLDQWGQPYVLLLDTDYDNQIANPDANNTDPKISAGAPPLLKFSVAIYSTGPDKTPHTKDDITSWR